jgi:transcriptional regulator with XRE-family HTH domain
MQPTGEWLNQPGGLTERLRALRHASGLTQAELATRLGWTRTKVPKLENGQQMPTKDDLSAWATACGHPEVIPELLAILSQAEVLHRQWQHELRRGQAALQVSFDELVRDAAVIRDFEIMLIPGLLQTPQYARYRALEAVRLQGTDESKVDEVVAARMRRQEVLYKPAKRFQFVICKAALDYLLCPPQVMRAQLDRLIVALGMSNIEFGIIPPGTVLPVAPMVGFLIADDVTVVETFTSADTLRGEESAKYAEFADGLMAQAVTGDDARDLITAAARDLPLRRGVRDAAKEAGRCMTSSATSSTGIRRTRRTWPARAKPASGTTSG